MSRHNKQTAEEVSKQVPVPNAEGSVKSADVRVEEQKHPCSECRWYDVSTQRDFRRDGIRQGLCEVRAICRATKDISKASGHLVKRESNRSCFDTGVYVVPVKEKKTKKEHPAEKKTETQQKSATQTVEPKERPPEQKGSRKHEQPSAPRAMLKGCKA
jgi:hypothetical protein